MLKNQTSINGEQVIDSVNHPFVRLPSAGLSTVFQGWGPRI
ncbi:MAG TPA: hypothetical protein VIX35_11135 [Vicinamibacterales bacterium]|jgi:hypothetical protein